MKNIHIGIIAVASALVIGCGEKKEANSTPAEQTPQATETAKNIDTVSTAVATGHTNIDADAVVADAPVVVKVRGTVIAVQNGKDGYTATIKDDSGKLYDATISKINMDPEAYKTVAVGDVITVKGQSWKAGEKLNIKVDIMQ